MVKKFYNPNREKYGIHLYTCGNEDCCDGFTCAPHIRRDYLIHYIIDGSGYFEENGNTHKVNKGDIFVIYPGEIVSYSSPDPRYTWSFCWIGITGNDAERYLENAGVSRSNRVIKLNNFGFFETVVRMLEYAEGSDSISDTKLNGMVLNCLYSIEKSTGTGQSEDRESIVSKAIVFIENNYMHPITVGDIVDYIKLDRTYFYRLFKKETRRSPEQFLMEYRIEQACRLIRQSNFTFAAIAEYVGLNNQQYFSRLFKKIIGMTPGEYKKQI